MKNYYLICFFLSVVPTVYAQQTVGLSGKVFAGNEALENISVVNRTQKTETITKANGGFVITAALGDELVFSNANFKTVFRKISSTDLKSVFLTVEMEAQGTQLEEMVIEKVTTKSLGINAAEIIAKSKAHPTNMDFIAIFTALFGSKNKTKRPKEWSVDQKLELVMQVVSEDFLQNKLKMKAEHTGLFYYFLTEQDDFMETLKSSNQNAIQFLLLDKYQAFMEKMPTE